MLCANAQFEPFLQALETENVRQKGLGLIIGNFHVDLLFTAKAINGRQGNL